MEHASDSHLEKVYALLLVALNPEQKAEVQQIMDVADAEYARTCTTLELLSEALEKGLQEKVQEYERTQRCLERMEQAQLGGLDDKAEVDTMRIQSRDALLAMEQCLAERTDREEANAQVKVTARRRKMEAMRGVTERFGTALSPSGAATAPSPAEHPKDAAEPRASSPKEWQPAAVPVEKMEAEVNTHYEPLQSGHVDLVIRVPAAFNKMNIAVDESGVITKAPGGIFTSDYRILGVDGKRFYPGLQDTDGQHNVVLQCKDAVILRSLARVPAKQFRRKSLKLLQVQLTPGIGSFGIDLTDFNGVAGLVKGGAADNSDLKPGDIIIGVDGVNLGSHKLTDVLQRGKKSYIFSVLRPMTLTPADMPSEFSSELSQHTEQTEGTVPHGMPTAKPPESTQKVQDVPKQDAPDDLKRSLAESLGRLQTQTEMLNHVTAVDFVRLTPIDGTAIKVEWAARGGPSSALKYHFEWRRDSDPTWTNSDASRALKSNLVTKGNLHPNGAYYFRVRACGPERGEWGPWATSSFPVRPDGVIHDQLPTITEESMSEVGSTAMSITSVAKASVANSTFAGQSVAMETMQTMLLNQRQALVAEHSVQLEQEEARMQEELKAVQEELADWKIQFAEAAGNSIQAVADAKAATRAEVVHELEAESSAVVSMKAEAEQAIKLIRAAEAAAADAKQESERYKARYEAALEEARALSDKEAEAKLNVVMRNASLELRDKVKFVEQQTDTTVRRAVDDAVRLAEARAEVARKAAQREYEIAKERDIQRMSTIVGTSTLQKINEMQQMQDARSAHAVKEALAEAEESAKRREAAAVESAVHAAVEETETKYLSRQQQLEHQLAAAKKDLAAIRANMHSEEAVRVRIAKAREDMLKEKTAAVEDAVALEKRKAAIAQEKMAETLAERIKAAVQAREKELLESERQGLKALADSELKEQTMMVRHAGKAATAKWGGGNDDFEEQALAKTAPVPVLTGTKELIELPLKEAPNRRKKNAPPRDDDLIEHPPSHSSRTQSRSKRDDDEESMVAPSNELVKLRARHAVEVEALVARQGADEKMEPPEPDDDAESVVTRTEGRSQRARAEMEELRQRHMAEALVAGAALVNEERAKLAAQDQLQALENSSELIELLGTSVDAGVKEASKENPLLKDAIDRVENLETQLLSLKGEGGTGMGSQDHKRSADAVHGMLMARDKQGSLTGVSDEERASLQKALALLKGNQQRDGEMQETLKALPKPLDHAVGQMAHNVQSDLNREERINAALAEKLQGLLARDSKGDLSQDEVVILRDLNQQLQKQHAHAEMRQAQIFWLRAEARRARVAELLEARDHLERLHLKAAATARLGLPFAPIASAEDAESISVDWAAPATGDAVRYHLQWRACGESQWTSSEASEHIDVPCCTKGSLIPETAYEFRVRAADQSGLWGGWSDPTEPTTPSAQLSQAPPRPRVRSLGKGSVQLRWSAPDVSDASKLTGYEVQWRRCDGVWGEPGSTVETHGAVAAISTLQPHTFYVFRVRASIDFRFWTDFGPPSTPVQLPKSKSKAASEQDISPPTAGPALALPMRKPVYTADDDESVIAEDIRQMAAVVQHPEVQAAADATLAQFTQKKQEDSSNLSMLEERSKALLAKGRAAQLNELTERDAHLNELIAMKQKRLANDDEPNPTDSPAVRVSVDSWD